MDYYTAKILQEEMYLTFPIWTKSLTKFIPKMQDFKLGLKLLVKGELYNLSFLIGFQMRKICFFQMALNKRENQWY